MEEALGYAELEVTVSVAGGQSLESGRQTFSFVSDQEQA